MSEELLQGQEDDFVDMTFGVDDYRLENGYWLIDVSALHDQQKVGLRLAVQQGMRPGLIDEELGPEAVYDKGVLLMPLPGLSDALADGWSAEYGFSGTDSFNDRLEPLTAIVLEGDGRNLETERVRIKLFYDKMPDEEMDDKYFELFLNINLPGKLLALNEKDPDYRQPIYQAICI